MPRRLSRLAVASGVVFTGVLGATAQVTSQRAWLLAATGIALTMVFVAVVRRIRAGGPLRPRWAEGLAVAGVTVLAVGSLRPVLAFPGCLLLAVAAVGLLRWPPDRPVQVRFALDLGIALGGWAALAVLLIPTVSPVAVALVAVGGGVLIRGGPSGGRPLAAGALTAGTLLAAAASVHYPLAGLGACLLVAAATEAGDLPRDAPSQLGSRAAVAAGATVAPLLLAVGTAAWSATRGEVTTAAATLLTVAVLAGFVRMGLALADGLLSRATLDARVAARTLELVQQEQWFRSLVQNSSDVITVVDVRGLVRYQSPSVASVFGLDPLAAVGTPLRDLLAPEDAERVAAALLDACRRPRSTARIECRFRHADGSWRTTETVLASLVDDPDIRGLVLNTRDVSDRTQLQVELTQAAFTDSLTGLANRALFRERVERGLSDWDGSGSEEVVVVFCDLDGFKAVNDAQGHAVGDQLLGLVAERITHCVRPGDTVARLGGDEFAVLLTGVGADDHAVAVAERIGRVLAQPFLLDGREIYVGTSAGIASTSSGADSAEELLRNADLAMYRAKASPEVAYIRFEPVMHDALMGQVALESDLRQAMARGEFTVHYQPTVDLRSGRIVGAEALLRWLNPERGVVPTETVIRLAERSGMIVPLGEWVLREALTHAVQWQRYLAPGELFSVAVNLSGRQLQPALVATVTDLLAETGLAPAALVLEMTESVLIERTDDVLSLLAELKAIGVRLAIDDFGTGYSSLSYLAKFPVDILKIDRSFVEALGTTSASSELTETIVALGRSLKLDTVAEGIERGDQLAELRRMGCGYGQGFLFARPMPAKGLCELLALRDAVTTQPTGDRRLQAV